MELAKYVQTEMGQITNLITDMTLKGATVEEMNRATEYSRAVIDGAKRRIDYVLQSAKGHGIAELMAKYRDTSRKYKTIREKIGEITMTSEEAEAFLRRIENFKRSGMNEKAMADALHLKTVRFRELHRLARRMRRNEMIAKAKSLRSEGVSVAEIAKRIGVTENSVKELCAMEPEERPHVDKFRLVKIATPT